MNHEITWHIFRKKDGRGCNKNGVDFDQRTTLKLTVDKTKELLKNKNHRQFASTSFFWLSQKLFTCEGYFTAKKQRYLI